MKTSYELRGIYVDHEWGQPHHFVESYVNKDEAVERARAINAALDTLRHLSFKDPECASKEKAASLFIKGILIIPADFGERITLFEVMHEEREIALDM